MRGEPARISFRTATAEGGSRTCGLSVVDDVLVVMPNFGECDISLGDFFVIDAKLGFPPEVSGCPTVRGDA